MMAAACAASTAAGEAETKITVVGDGNTGKTCMLMAFVYNTFPEDHVATIFDDFKSEVIVDGIKHDVKLWDTAGQEEYKQLRPLSYPNTEVFLLCFAVNSRASYENVTSKWMPELMHHCKDAKIVLVATKIDLRAPEANGDSGASGDLVTTKDGRKMKSRINAARYMECSAKTRQGVQEVFQEAIRCLKEDNKKQKKFCSIL